MSEESGITWVPTPSSMIRWTTEPPTAEGWYWAYNEHGVQMINIAPDSIGDFLVAWDGEVPNGITYYSHWLGPLPVPEPPNG